jgi:hypothetical protein
MRVLIIVAALVALGTSSASANIMCWYNASGQYTGADGDDGRFPVGKVTKSGSGDYSWVYVVTGMPSDCPKKLPPH